ncbi:phosphorothioated DNA-binding restriction endonuclease [Nocardiopsis mangrovi]|uniref:Phosphorothioated DNA-binding restriction endonuclease n=1 Tax=Nocardiopsis mangrovi TaxID=1179818 RepID=A0ABV9E306_9ACTN
MDWVERIAGIRQWSRSGYRAPHKPLLLLYALGHYQRHGPAPIVYSAAEEQLGRLLKEFGPPRPTTPAYPFHHLTADGVWTVRSADGAGSPGPRVGRLRATDARGRLAPDLADALADDPRLLGRIARSLLDANFAPSLHTDICVLAGLALDAADAVGEDEAAGRRDPRFREQLLMAYEYRCAFCGFDGWLDGSAVALEAAHVRWRAYGGPDDPANGLCLCSLHHKLFDKGVLGLAADRTVTVSQRFVGRGGSARDVVLALSGRPSARPQPGFSAVDAGHVDWHTREVFRSPARAMPAADPV